MNLTKTQPRRNRRGQVFRTRPAWFSAGSFLVLFFLCVFSVACFDETEQDTAEKWHDRDQGLDAKRKEIKKIEIDLRDAVKDLTCELSSHCDVRSLGPETCGKRSQFIVYSLKRSDSGEVERLVNRYNELSDEINRSSYKVLSCGKTPPRALCVDRICLAEGYKMPKKILETKPEKK
jgi:hypothetical protein